MVLLICRFLSILILNRRQKVMTFPPQTKRYENAKKTFLALLTEFARHGAENFKIHVISELEYLRRLAFLSIPSASQCRTDVKTEMKIICLPTKPLKTFRRICLKVLVLDRID